MKWLVAIFALIAAPIYAECRASISLHSGVNWAGFEVEIAATEQSQAIGLMQRETLDFHRGMLFMYPQPEMRVFWMKDTPLSLDILFFDEKLRLINVAKNTEPFSTSQIPSEAAALLVLEINGGLFDRLGLEQKTKLRINDVNYDQCPDWVEKTYNVTKKRE